MSNPKLKVILASLVLVTAVLALSVNYRGGTVSAKETCDVGILIGTYGNSFQFLNLPPGAPVPQSIGIGTHTAGGGIAAYTFDGQGNFSGPSRVSFGGLILTGSVTGTYTVDANCMGSMLLNIAGAPPAQLDFVVVDEGNEIRAVSVGQGDIALNNMRRQFSGK